MKLVILGGGYAGLLAAVNARYQLEDADITLVDQHTRFSHRVRWHEQLAGTRIESYDYREHSRRHNYRFVQARATSVDGSAQTVRLDAPGYAPDQLQYDYLIVALGSRVKAPAQFERRDNVHCLNSSNAVQQATAASGGHWLVVGGGLTAVEYATELASAVPGAQISLATSALLPGYTTAARDYVRTAMSRMGINLHERCRIEALQDSRAVTAAGETLAFDHCLLATGFSGVGLPGLNRQHNGQLAVNEFLQAAGEERVFVVGDAAAAHLHDGRPVRMSCASAMAMVPTAIDNIRRHRDGEPLAPLSPFYLMHCISLGRDDGVLQFVTADDRMADTIVSGEDAIAIKDQIGRAVIATLDWDQRQPLSEPWPDFGALIEQYA